MEAKKTTTYPSSYDVRGKEQVDAFLKHPFKVQKLLFNKIGVQGYNQLTVYEHEDYISCVISYITLKASINSFYRSYKKEFFITYKTKGASPRRLSGNYNTKDQLIQGFKVLSKYTGVEEFCKNLLNSRFASPMLTKGMLSSILAGKLTTEYDVIEYYFKYSLKLKGFKPSFNMLTGARNYLQNMSMRTLKYILRITIDPGYFLLSHNVLATNIMHNENTITSFCLSCSILDKKVDMSHLLNTKNSQEFFALKRKFEQKEEKILLLASKLNRKININCLIDKKLIGNHIDVIWEPVDAEDLPF